MPQAYKVFFNCATSPYISPAVAAWRSFRSASGAATPYVSSHTSQELKMDKPVVLITGALTGIGRAAALAFARKGAKVIVAGRRDEAGKALVKELRSLGAEAEFINADVRKENDVRAMVDKTVARFGRLDVAVNNAATEGQLGPITDQTAESFDATFETNVLGVVLSMKHEVRAMQAQRSGSISDDGTDGSPRFVGRGRRWHPLHRIRRSEIRNGQHSQRRRRQKRQLKR